ncbi:MAG: caspase family protein [Frankiales bacterium]|nr:caspase family protein [Frankiales bacterium]
MTRLRAATVVATLLAVAACFLPAQAAAPATAARGLSVTYSRAGGVTIGGSTWTTEPGAWQRVGATEDRVRVQGVDSSGSAIAISLDYTPRGYSSQVTTLVCGSSPYLSVTRGSQLRVTPVAGRCTNGLVSVPRSGHVALTFLRPLPKPKSKVIPPSQRWGVVIGISQYAGRTHDTYGGVGDADAVRASLLTAGWKSDHLLVLKNGQASGQAIVDAMVWLARHSTSTSYSFFHFSGHACISSRGGCPSGHTYLWGADNRFVPETTVSQVLGQVRGRAWFDFASCESGAFDNGLHSPLRLVTAASQPHETAYESQDWHESVWSGLVFDQAYLKGYAGRQKHRATITEMVAYGVQNAPRYTSRQARGPQHPYSAGGEKNQSLWAPHV